MLLGMVSEAFQVMFWRSSVMPTLEVPTDKDTGFSTGLMQWFPEQLEKQDVQPSPDFHDG